MSVHLPTFCHHLVQTPGARGQEAQVRFAGPKDAAEILGVELHADKPGMVGQFENLHAVAVGVFADKGEAVLGQGVDVCRVDFVAMTVAFGDDKRRG